MATIIILRSTYSDRHGGFGFYNGIGDSQKAYTLFISTLHTNTRNLFPLCATDYIRMRNMIAHLICLLSCVVQ